MPQFILYVVTYVQASSIKVFFYPDGGVVYLCVFCMQLSPTQDASKHSTGTEPSRCKTLIIDACMHITTDNINSEFYSSICQHHINCSIHIFIIRDAIIFNMYI